MVDYYEHAGPGERMSEAEGLEDRVRLIHADYTAIPLADHSVDYAYAIESMCHARGVPRARGDHRPPA